MLKRVDRFMTIDLLPLEVCERLNLVAAIHGCHDELFLDSPLLGLSLSESLSLGLRLGALNLCGSKISFTVKDVTACLVSGADSSSGPEISFASSPSLLRLPLLLLSMRELIENRSLPCILNSEKHCACLTHGGDLFCAVRF